VIQHEVAQNTHPRFGAERLLAAAGCHVRMTGLVRRARQVTQQQAALLD
jgi:hypothetical protein